MSALDHVTSRMPRRLSRAEAVTVTGDTVSQLVIWSARQPMERVPVLLTGVRADAELLRRGADERARCDHAERGHARDQPSPVVVL